MIPQLEKGSHTLFIPILYYRHFFKELNVGGVGNNFYTFLVYLFIYLFIYLFGCVGTLLLGAGFL